MKHVITLVVAVLVIGVLAAYMVTFTVRYDEVAVRKTFERVDQNSLIRDPGLHFRWPWPIQKVETYSTRLQVLEESLEQVATKDDRTVVVRVFVVWRIEDPYQFAKTVEGGVAGAERRLRPMVRDAVGVISGKDGNTAGGGTGWAWEDLVNRNPDEVELDAIEAAMADRLRAKLADIDPSYGIAVERVGIRRLVLPGTITEKVAERMVKAQESAASIIEEEARGNAETIRSEAESARQRILAWAEKRAKRIRAEGDRAAAIGLRPLQENQDFATYLREIETLKSMMAQSPQMILRFDDWRPLQMLRYGPVAVEGDDGKFRIVPRNEAEEQGLTPASPGDPGRAPTEPEDDSVPLAGDGADDAAAAPADDSAPASAADAAAAEASDAASADAPAERRTERRTERPTERPTEPASAGLDPAALERALDADATPRVDIAGHNTGHNAGHNAESDRNDAVAEVETD